MTNLLGYIRRHIIFALLALSLPFSAHSGVGDSRRLFAGNSPPTTKEYSDFGAFQAEMDNGAVLSCQGHGWALCVHTTDTHGPEYSKDEQVLDVGWRGCWPNDHSSCVDSSFGMLYWSAICPLNQVWETFSDGIARCVGYGNKNLDEPKRCQPKLPRPIYPLTGVQRHEVSLGMSIGGTPLSLTYDTRDRLPETNGARPWIDAPVPSFGAMWQSNVHRSLQLQGASSTPGAAYTGVTVQRGGNDNESFAPSGGIDTCGGAVAGATGDYSSHVNPAQKITFDGANGRLIDQHALTEETYAANGTLTTMSMAGGGTLSYSYSTSVTTSAPAVGLLSSVADQFGRTVQFTYEQPSVGADAPRVTTTTGPDGLITTASYDPNSGNLTGLTWPNGSGETFLYERPDLPWALTGIVDENSARYISLGYDAHGRANASQLANGVDSYAVQYDPSPLVAPHWQVDEAFIESVPVVCRIRHWVTPSQQFFTTPTAQQITIGESSVMGMPVPINQSQPAGIGCSASSSSGIYDAASNLLSHDDFNGNRACYAYEQTRNLTAVTLEGLPTTKACPATLSSYTPPMPADAAHPERKTTTVWHPDWVLKTLEAEPKKITTWVYNGQPDPVAGGTASCVTPATTLPDGRPLAMLCARYERATTDATGGLGLLAAVTGATRAWTSTYNQYGQVLTETTPKQGQTDMMSHMTTYAYYATTSFSGSVGHTMGDLSTITNPLSQVITFTSYDKAGRLLSSKDANATVTAMTYLPRGWLRTQTVTANGGASLTTTYDYWPTGLLKTVTMPDVSTLNYAYDDAHRLTDVTDSAANKIHYVLDNVGNRTSEQVTDASGQLASAVMRVFDQLNRVQSTTGAMH